ncbi:sulfide/dihydroorotate dehydrogenase-like FAD/NAD-binding protein [Clostridium oryzae]|uniref:Dihydroorotate dehydrogenase B, electron transfer subunit n=1 Tax=Clostridium oryzae TaxID=1450648 RepID=A0A1V4IT20_9CLOT|nr:sulfide/dihydroorotate dehydrogenase-like FAD/NAD-binding protein [Clostridium oryzae]OPJ63181.1 dihydroorotate dehydrogenase B, electron transfer subunit [Clostridium oryzae]
MNYEDIDCIDAGTEYCPCHLAEAGECILCSQLRGCNFCDCVNWKGVCIYQEYNSNGCKPKDQRKNYKCIVVNKDIIGNDIVIFTIQVPHNVCQSLIYPGSYVFIRTLGTMAYYDCPISVMEADTEKNYIKLAIEIRGIKTKQIKGINVGESIIVRAPFWNGIFGLKNIYMAKSGTSIVIARGIGQAPMIPVLKKLNANNNKVLVIIDRTNNNDDFVSEYLKKYRCDVIEMKTLDNGELSQEFKEKLLSIVQQEKVNLVHCDGPDILNLKISELLGEHMKLSCSNNIRMCCGEGVCGSCSTRYKGHKVKRLCKMQMTPQKLFEGRRFV